MDARPRQRAVVSKNGCRNRAVLGVRERYVDVWSRQKVQCDRL